jgi:peptide/nickel transport system substrate-binding protein
VTGLAKTVHKAGPLALIGWGDTTWDADGTLTPLFRTGKILSNYHNPEFDTLIDTAATTVDPKARLATYAKALKLWVDDGAAIPLYQQMDLYGAAKRVRFQALSSEQLVGPWICLADQKC